MEKERGRTGALALVTRSLHGPSWSHADSFFLLFAPLSLVLSTCLSVAPHASWLSVVSVVRKPGYPAVPR